MSATTILIVDDEPTMLASMSSTLSPGYLVRAANSGSRALQVAVSNPRPDLILLDINMPQMDGYAVLSRLQHNPVTRDTPVIFITAMESEADEEKALAMGAVDYITKPMKPAILLARVKAHVLLKQARDFLTDQNNYLEAEIVRRLEENQRIQNVSIRALAHLAETRDPETGHHILRTQNYVQLLAKRLQSHPRFRNTISDYYIQLLTKSAPLHDIGKVGIPDHVLLKKGRLTDEEWAIMKTHAELGARAIELAEQEVDQPVEFLRLAREIAHWHHEQWDGSGYPNGLSGDAIPVSARLMALADVFDALISRRVYKPSMPFDEARRIILDDRGRHFDPDVTDAFAALYGEFVAIALRYRDGTA